MKTKTSMTDSVKAIVWGLIVLAAFMLSFYACEVAPMQECMDNHSFGYCYRLLNK